MKNHIKALILFMLFLPLARSFAGDVLETDSDKQFGFAEYYFSEGEYLKAIAEYERFIHFFPENDRVAQAKHHIGMSYFQSSQFEAAIKAFGKIIDSAPDFQSSIPKAYFMISECYMKLKAPGPAMSNLHNLIAIAGDGDTKDEAYYRLGWICLEAGPWDKARAYFGEISPENRDKYRLETLSAELGKTALIKKKHPAVAGVLSVLPGAGYLYCERYHDAATSFLVNGLLMYAAYEAFDNGNDVLGGLITFVELGFYTGNIYGSVSSAHKYNQAKIMGFVKDLKKSTKVGLSVGKNDGVFLSFQHAF